MNLPPPPQHDDPIITQFKPVYGQWELNDENIKRIDPKTRETILHNYCKYINTTPLEVYRYLIETKSYDIKVWDEDHTPLHDGLDHFDRNRGGDITVLHYLLNQEGVKVNTRGRFGYTLLHWACIKINKLPIDIFKCLIETHGADVNAQDNAKNTPLHRAVFFFNPNNDGAITVLYYLINQKGINANIKNLSGETLLHWACLNVNYLPLDVFNVLIETHGADVNVQDNDNDTPLHCALRNFNPDDDGGDITVLAYLINQKYVNVNITGRQGRNLLHLTCLRTYLDSSHFSTFDSNLCQIVEIIAEKWVQQVLDDTTS
jgi:ankyrin repeat protein